MSEETSSPETWAMVRLLRDMQGDRPAAPPGFEILSELGRGGMGVVYRAREVALDRVVALKVLIAGEDAPDELLERFEREARAAAKLSHPNIVEVLSTGREGALRWIAMGLVEGRPLSRLGRLPVRHALEVTRKLALALGHAHERGVLHRDVKPANVLIDAQGEPQLVDFGLARDQSLGSLTIRGEKLGTPAFSSPEQLSGHSVDARTDVYSLGATLYAMLTGRVPFEGTAAARVAEAVLRDAPPRPSSIAPDIPREAEALCLRAMEKDARARTPSARDLADEIDQYLAGEAVRPAKRTRSTGIYVAVALALALVGAGIWRTATNRRMIEPSEDEREGAESSLVTPGPSFPVSRHMSIHETDSGRVSGVLSDWARLRGDLKRLDGVVRDWRLSEERRAEEAAAIWPVFERFRLETSADPVSQAAMRGLFGWARVVKGERDAGLEEMLASTAVHLDVPIGRLMAALLFFSEYVEGIPMPGVELGPKGVEFAEVPSESAELAAVRERMQELLADARKATIWGLEGADDFSSALEGVLALQRGNYSAAEEAISDAMSSPDLRVYETGLLHARGRVRYLAMRFEEALEDFHEVQAARPGEPAAFFDAAECAVAATTTRIWRGEEPFSLLEEALASYTKVMEWDPAAIEPLERRAHARRLRGEALVARGESGAGEFRDAEKDLRAAIQRGLDTEAVHLELASLFVTLGRGEAMGGLDFRPSYARALEVYDALLARADTTHRPWLGRGAAHAELGKAILQRKMPQAAEHFERAVSDLGKALDLRPGDVLTLTNRGGAWIGLGTAKRESGESGADEFRSAIADFNAVLETDPAYTSAYNNRAGAWAILGSALRAEGKEPWECYGLALADFGEVLRRNSGDASHWNNRAMFWRVVAEARQSAGQDPGEALDAALSDFSEALARNPRLWVARLGRGQVHEARGDHALAADDYQAAYDVVGDAYPTLPDMIRRERDRAAQDPRR